MEEIKIAILALGSTGFVFSVILAFLSKKFKVEQDPRVEKVLSILPGINCGVCGFSGCKVFAENVVKENSLFSGCLPGGAEVNNEISQTLSINANLNTVQQVVVCHCQAEINEKKVSSIYEGLDTCRAADIIGGAIDCLYGCIGFGDCLTVCPTKALILKNKRIHVDIEKCIGCGRCLKYCPRNLFTLQAQNSDFGIYYIACNNKENAILTKRVCSRGCIGCGICVRIPGSPYYLKEKLSFINYDKAIEKSPLENAKLKCPPQCIFTTTTENKAKKE